VIAPVKTILIGSMLALAATALAGVQATYLGSGPSDGIVPPADTTPGDCRVGNLRGPAGLLDSSQWGGPWPGWDVLAVLADLDSTQCGCEGGFAALTLKTLLMNQTDHAVDLYVWMGLDGQGLEFPYDPSETCAVPNPGYGGEVAVGQEEYLTLPFPGLYEVEIPVDGGCAFFGYTYFLTLWIPSPDDSGVTVVVDGDPRPCAFFHATHIGERWWWNTHDDEGAPLLWAEAACCYPPVGTERSTWGKLKAMYR